MSKKIKFLELDQKKTYSVKLYNPIINFVKAQYGTKLSSKYDGTLQNIQKMRDSMSNLQNNTEYSRDVYQNYAAYLVFIRSHFPINSGLNRVKNIFFINKLD